MNENSHLPIGTIVRRNIRGKTRFYHQWREDGKTKSRYLKPSEILPLREQLGKAKSKFRKNSPPATLESRSETGYSSAVITGRLLDELAASTQKTGKRTVFDRIDAFLNSETGGIFVLHGLPRSGKSTLLRQCIAALPDEMRAMAAYISLSEGVSPKELFSDLLNLRSHGIRIMLIDGLERAAKSPLAAMADIFPELSCKIVISADDRLFCADAHLPYPTASANAISFQDYCNISKSRNLKGYLLEGGIDRVELSDYLNRALTEVTQRFIASAIDLRQRHHQGKSANRVENDISKIARHLSERVPGEIDRESLKTLERMGVIVSSEGESLIAIPALRHKLVSHTVNGILDEDFCGYLGAAEKKLVAEEIFSLCGDKALSDTLLTETIRARTAPEVDVFRVRFRHGGFDIVVADREELTCEIYEVRNTFERTPGQLFNLTDQLKLDAVEHRYGTIIARELIYLGRNARHSSGVLYKNAADYLESLPRI
jgi:hypothetical protein